MIMQVFALLDTKTGAYGQPFFVNHPAAAFRAVQELLGDPTAMPSKYPSDFELWKLGAFDDQLGEFAQHDRGNMGNLVGFMPPPKRAMPLFDGAAPPLQRKADVEA